LFYPWAVRSGIFYLGIILEAGPGGFQEVLAMPKEKKVKIVGNLQETFSKANIGIMTDYRGVTTAELNNLRRKLREAKVEYKVVKNTLALIAARNAGLEHTAESFKGPMAIAFGSGEIQDAAKALTEHIRTSKSSMKIYGGFLTDRVLTAKEIETLARLPSKSVLISQVMAGIQSPIYGFVNVLAAPMRGLMQVLQGRIQQMEGK
jgi:large subunit ribosomal protein L10